MYAPPDEAESGVALLAAMGMNKDQIETQLKQSDDVTWIHPANWKTLQLFIAMQTQWRTSMSGATGLDYAALPMAARGEGIRLTRNRFRGIRVMEREALRLMSERKPDGG